MKSIVLIAGFAWALALPSCSKKDSAGNPPTTPSGLEGFWKGSTSPGQTSSSYAVGVVLRTNGTARGLYFYGGSSFPPDTASAGVIKVEGSYTKTANTISVLCNDGKAQLNYQASITGSNTGLTGLLSFGPPGGVVYNNITVSMTK